MPTLIRVILIVLALLPTVAVAQPQANGSTTTLSVCDVLRDLKNLDGHMVAIQGVFSWSHHHGGNLFEPGLDGMPCHKMPRKARIWWSGISLDSSADPSLEGGPPTFKVESPTYHELAKMGEDLERNGKEPRLIVTLIGEIRTRKKLVIIRAPYGRDNTMGNGYGEGGAFPAMLVVQTFRDVRAVEKR